MFSIFLIQMGLHREATHRGQAAVLTLACILVACLALLVMPHSASATAFLDKLPKNQKISEAELAELLKANPSANRPKPTLPDDFDEDAAKAAREKLFEEKQKIEQLTAKQKEALEKWNSLTPEQQAHVVKLAQERAAKRAEDIKRNIELSEQLMVKEGIELEAKMDEELKREAEEEERQAREKLKKDHDEFERKRAEHHERQQTIRTTERSVFFWTATFLLSVFMSRFAVKSLS